MSKPIEICGLKFIPPDTLTEVQADKWAEIQTRNKYEDAVTASRRLENEIEEVKLRLGAYQKYIEIADKRLEASTPETIEEDLTRSEGARQKMAKAALDVSAKAGDLLKKKRPHDYIIESTYLEFAHFIAASINKKDTPDFETWQKVAGSNDYVKAFNMINRLYTPYFQVRALNQN
jgi:hypothetical protein